ncbi:hypothetical protein [Aquisphaera insulae]|uniref:hypothetical protein n=1 Tax=Aquisphaera insulae TaxID=2712864 RepID=UPI0013ED8E6A|nr:hypothetical protein [Aquisphaera insulae]
MRGRLIHHGIRSLVALALLVAMVISPIRPARALGALSSPSFQARQITKIGGRDLIGAVGQPSLKQAHFLQADIKDELEAEIEDDLIVIVPPAFASSQILPSPRIESCSEPIHFAVALVARPLRC